MEKGLRISLIFVIVFALAISSISAAAIDEDLHLNLQTTFSNGTIQAGTFDFVFNISTAEDCGTVVYTNSTSLTTDTRGIISYYLPDVSLDYDQQYWLCYYKDGSLESSSKISRTPYSFGALNVSAEGVKNDSNLDLTNYNITADTGFFTWLGSTVSRISNIFATDVNVSGEVNVTGNVTASWFKGIYNWVVGSSSSNYLSFNGTQLNFNETALNETIDTRVSGSETDPQWSANYTAYNDTWTTTDAEIWNIAGNGTLMFVADWNATNTSYVPYTGADANVILGANNLSVDTNILLVDATNDRVGIGTSSPTALLHLQAASGWTEFKLQGGDAVSGGQIRLDNSTGDEIAEIYATPTDDSFRIQTGGSDRFTIDSAGEVGIGTTTPLANLHIQTSTGWAESRLQGGDATSGGTLSLYNSSGNEIAEIYATPIDASLRFQTGGSDRFTIDSSGNVGIGTSTPQNLLNVLGDANVTGTLYRDNKPLIDWSQATNGTLYEADDVWTLVYNSTFANIDEPLWTANYTAYNDTWTTTDAEIWTVVDNSTFLYQADWNTNYSTNNDVWTTTNAEIWTVVDNSTFANIDEPLWTANYTAYNDTWTTTDAEIWTVVANDTFVPYTGANSNIVLGNNNFSVGGTDFFVDNNNGRVGVGTSTPLTDFHIKSTTVPILRLESSASSPNRDGFIDFYSDVQKWRIGWDDSVANDPFVFNDADDNTLMSILQNGNVGIGTTAPQNTLNVEGDINVTNSDIKMYMEGGAFVIEG